MLAELTAAESLTAADLAQITTQTERWRAPLAAGFPGAPARIHGVLRTPLLTREGEGWAPAASPDPIPLEEPAR